MNFTEKDIKQIAEKGLTVENLMSQINTFQEGLPYTKLRGVATLNHGILKVSDAEKKRCIDAFENKRNQISMVKFVPASGAATRMFKFLFQFLKEYNPQIETVESYVNNNEAKDVLTFFSSLEKLPFYDDVLRYTKQTLDGYDNFSERKKQLALVRTILDNDKLNFGSFPKGLLPFHKYKDQTRTAFEEHLYEATLYASNNRKAVLHYTISEHHKDKFDKKLNAVKTKIEGETGVCFNVSFSFQKSSTDTLGVTLNNEPFRLEDGSMHFRPSGHGALIENLSAIDADIVFIKNIDNVVVSKHINVVSDYKKMLAGLLLNIQNQAFKFLEELDNGNVNEGLTLEIAQFLTAKMSIVLDADFDDFNLNNKTIYLKEKLNRPIRICGMVKNEGAPGGGPFWIEDEDGKVSLQIVESAQIDLDNQEQKRILNSATYFNPVDLVCGFKDYKGNRFNLTEFVDYKAAFISNKTKTGNAIKGLELPGLWNGSMANWNTIFVEVPLETFNPVKTVNDLLKTQHQVL